MGNLICYCNVCHAAVEHATNRAVTL
jgi:hypothetical protein